MSFAKYPKWNPCYNGSIVLEFATRHPDGLLLYTDDGGLHDFFELKLVSGVGWLRFNLGGDGVILLKAGLELNDGTWHKVEITRDEEETTIAIDNVKQSGQSTGNDLMFGDDVKNSDVYVGGMPEELVNQLHALALPSVVFEPHYRGQLRGLRFSDCGGTLRDATMIASRGVRQTRGDYCTNDNPCQHGGMCISTDNGSICECAYTGYEGELCEKGTLE